ncbi:NAD(P)-dependent oxidoreductase [Streptomyces chumphonensis]|uniref:NAD-dependent epimerase/dehydratase family protein n=1 Tax=Streptomyces chumphonensis TaxID=1214925 RepID=A0A927F0Y3_9ACTN|nr:NAD-dependent epimerase/dehydratase family protein [Streptomyces chumphonensis]MBD3933408.1 NAD-dependent epimerase/dehydratase family protein [Streptomyces chumphonensis]
MKIAVTGAGGFVGAAVCRAARAAGWSVHPLTRADWDLTRPAPPGLPAVDAVVHAAAAVADWGPPEPVWRANLDGTRHVADAFRGTRLVHVSTASVYDPFRPTVRGREEQAPVRRYLTPYAASKAAAERALADRPDTVVLRPHAVYGPGDRTLLPRVLDAVRGGVLLLPGDGRAAQSLTHIDHLTAAVLLACDPAAPPGTYNVADAAPVPVGDALAALLAERGRTVRVLPVPLTLAGPAATAAETAWRLLRRPHPPRLTRYALSHLAVERTLDLGAARRDLGFDPGPTSFAGAAHW